MLDAFIIERIRREREERRDGRLPIHVEVPAMPEQEPLPTEQPEPADRGVVIVEDRIPS
ncbi:MAG: hypothetical protein JXB39_07650 [Deltaproteobacteria bacterium]|nr:hypothetical protein [Deltaproteobacteria bacterium]